MTAITQDSATLRRRMAAAREQLHAQEPFRRGASSCPAGVFVAITNDGSPGCHCVIEQETISEARSPASLTDFCFGSYLRCPTWRAEKARIEAGRRQALVEMSTGRQPRKLVPVDGVDTLVMEGDRPGRDEEAVPRHG